LQIVANLSRAFSNRNGLKPRNFFVTSPFYGPHPRLPGEWQGRSFREKSAGVMECKL